MEGHISQNKTKKHLLCPLGEANNKQDKSAWLKLIHGYIWLWLKGTKIWKRDAYPFLLIC